MYGGAGLTGSYRRIDHAPVSGLYVSRRSRMDSLQAPPILVLVFVFAIVVGYFAGRILDLLDRI